MIETYLIQALIILFTVVLTVRIWFEVRNMLHKAREDWDSVTPIEELDKVPTRLPYEPEPEDEAEEQVSNDVAAEVKENEDSSNPV